MMPRLALVPRQSVQTFPAQPEQIHQRLLLCLIVRVLPIDLRAKEVRGRPFMA